MSIRPRGAGATAKGRRRSNEDVFLAAGAAFLVADGMGGHHAGAEAARAVVDAFDSIASVDTHMPVTIADVNQCIAYAREAVADVRTRHGGQPGSTLTGAIAIDIDGSPWWLVINVGDSRVSCYTAGHREQITIDHSRVQELIDARAIEPSEATQHPERNIITRAIGDDGEGADQWLVPMRPNHTLVIASDGLTKALSEAEITALLTMDSEPQSGARQLVERAVEAGASDNVTVVLATTDATSPHDAPTTTPPLWTGSAVFATDDDEHTLLSSRDDHTSETTRIATRATDDSAIPTATPTPEAPTPHQPIAPMPPSATPSTTSPVAHIAPRTRRAARLHGQARTVTKIRSMPVQAHTGFTSPIPPDATGTVLSPTERRERETRQRRTARQGFLLSAAITLTASVSLLGLALWLLAGW